MRDAELERAVKSIRSRKRAEEGKEEDRARRRSIRKDPKALCVTCGGKARQFCTACHRYLCDACAVALGSKRFCGEACIRQLQQMEDAMAAGHERDRWRDFRMWLADPGDRDIYRRLFRGAIVVAVALILWNSMRLLTHSRQRRDIRERGIQAGVNLEGVPVQAPTK